MRLHGTGSSRCVSRRTMRDRADPSSLARGTQPPIVTSNKRKKKARKRERGAMSTRRAGTGGAERTASQIGFIVRLMKAITRGRVVPRARGIARGCGASRTHACHGDRERERQGNTAPGLRHRRGGPSVARSNNVTHRSFAFAN